MAGARPAPVLVLPGWMNSGPDHWQSRWERDDPTVRRVEQANWDTPDPRDWVVRIAGAVSAADTPPVLVAHSLGCIAAAHYAAGTYGPARPLAGALLVAPADVERPAAAEALRPFAPIPGVRLPCPGIVVASRDDPYLAFARAVELASQWGCELVDAGPAGHLNADAGYGNWPAGRVLLDRLRAAAG